MRVSSINNYNCQKTNQNFSNNLGLQNENKLSAQPNVYFTGDDKKASRAMRNTILALCMLPAAGSMVMSSCDDDPAYAYEEANANANAEVSIDTTGYHHCGDTIIQWYYKYQRPLPLDTLMNNFHNWDIDSTDIDLNDSTAKRNIIHYEGVREWEYNTREIGDMNILESTPKNNLVYDTEIVDYKGDHISYGKRIFRIPTSKFTITTKDGRTLHSPKGIFVEEYENDFDEKGSSILDCTLKSRAFCQTNGDTLNVAKRKNSNEFVETGKVAKGYLGANSILLKNLIGEYPTDDHVVDFKIEAINDKELRLKYVKAMDELED